MTEEIEARGIEYPHSCFLAAGFVVMSLLMILAGLMYTDVLGTEQGPYQICRFFLCLALGACAVLTMSKGYLAASLVFLVAAMSCTSFVLAHFLGFEHSSLQDPLFSIILFIVSGFFYSRRNHFVGIATFLFALSLLIPFFVEGGAMDEVLGIGLLVSGVLYAVYGGIMIINCETGCIFGIVGFPDASKNIYGIACNPYELGVPIASLFVGLMMLFLCVFQLFDSYTLSHGDLCTIVLVTIVLSAFSLYLCIRGILAPGLVYLLLSMQTLVQSIPTMLGQGGIPYTVYVSFIVPVVFVTILSFRKRDPVFGIVTMLLVLHTFVVCIAQQWEFYPDVKQFCGLMELAMALLFLYYGFSRWMLVAFRREVVPLFCGNMVKTQTLIDSINVLNHRRKPWTVPITMIYLGFMIIAILLIWTAIYNLGNSTGVIEISEMQYAVSRLVMSALIMGCVVFTIGRGSITYSLLMLTVGLSCIDCSIMEMFGADDYIRVNNLYGMFLLLGAAFYWFRGTRLLSVATLLFAISLSAVNVLDSQAIDCTLYGVMLVSGIIFGYLALSGFLMEQLHYKPGKSMEISGTVNENFNRIVTTLGYILFSLELLLSWALNGSEELYVAVFLHSFLIISLAMYCIGKEAVAEGISLLMPGLIVTMDCAASLAFGIHSPYEFWILLALMLVPPTMVFLYKSSALPATLNVAVLIVMLEGGVDSPHAILLVTASLLLILGISIYNWFSVEKENFRAVGLFRRDD